MENKNERKLYQNYFMEKRLVVSRKPRTDDLQFISRDFIFKTQKITRNIGS